MSLFIGGSSRFDSSALFFLRPFSVLVLFYAAVTVSRSALREHRLLVGFALALVCLPLVQLIPLPFQVWSALPGRDLIVEVDRQLGMEAQWRPLSLAPAGTLNAFFATLGPLAALLLAIQLTPRERWLLLPVLIVVGLIGGVLGLLQLLGPAGGPLYLHRVTHDDSAVGFFANRNHQAAFLSCMLPMLSVLAVANVSEFGPPRWRAWFALLAGAFIVPLILITGSRAGLALGAVGVLFSLPFLIAVIRRRLKSRVWLLSATGALVAGVSLVWVSIKLGRAEALRRAVAWDPGADERLAIWGPAWQMAKDFFPAGAGLGSFARVYEMYEPGSLMRTRYVNQAHNDWLEPLATTGAAGLLLLTLACAFFVRRAWTARAVLRNGSVSGHFVWLGLSIISLLALASVTDYPLRVPALAVFFVVACVWAFGTSQGSRGQAS